MPTTKPQGNDLQIQLWNITLYFKCCMRKGFRVTVSQRQFNPLVPRYGYSHSEIERLCLCTGAKGLKLFKKSSSCFFLNILSVFVTNAFWASLIQLSMADIFFIHMKANTRSERPDRKHVYVNSSHADGYIPLLKMNHLISVGRGTGMCAEDNAFFIFIFGVNKLFFARGKTFFA